MCKFVKLERDDVKYDSSDGRYLSFNAILETDCEITKVYLWYNIDNSTFYTIDNFMNDVPRDYINRVQVNNRFLLNLYTFENDTDKECIAITKWWNSMSEAERNDTITRYVVDSIL